MATEVKIPFLGHTMTEAKIVAWYKKEDDLTEAGEVLLDIETEKVIYGIESPISGVLKAILASVNDSVPVGETVAIVGAKDEKIDPGLYARRKHKEAIPIEAAESEPIKAIPSVVEPTIEHVLVSPAAKKLAQIKMIDLYMVKGSGRSGRIRLADVEKSIRDSEKPALKTPMVFTEEIADTIPMSSMRLVIAKRLTQSFHDIPHFNLCSEVDMTETMGLLSRLRGKTENRKGIRISINDLLLKAVAVNLRKYNLLNARLSGNQIEIMRDINIGLAVALEEGLIVPAFEKVDQKRLMQIAEERKDLVERAQQGQLTLRELERGTFTVSNLGQYGITFFTSIINPPQTGILSIGKVIERPVVQNGEIIIRPIAFLSLAIDHRVVDGAVGAQFLMDLKNDLEDPDLLI